LVTSEGLNLLLDIALGAVAKPSAYYVGLIDADTFSGFSTSDTMASHAGWTEITDYDEVTRPQVSFGAASANSISNTVAADITPNTAFNACGFFITTNSTKGGTTGYLFAVSIFDQGTRSVTSGVAEQFTMVVNDVNSSSDTTGTL